MLLWIDRLQEAANEIVQAFNEAGRRQDNQQANRDIGGNFICSHVSL